MPPSTPFLARIEEFEKNQKWFWSHFDQLLESHKDFFVAVWHQKVIGKDKDLKNLSKKINQKHAKGAYVQYVTEQPMEMIL